MQIQTKTVTTGCYCPGGCMRLSNKTVAEAYECSPDDLDKEPVLKQSFPALDMAGTYCIFCGRLLVYTREICSEDQVHSQQRKEEKHC